MGVRYQQAWRWVGMVALALALAGCGGKSKESASATRPGYEGPDWFKDRHPNAEVIGRQDYQGSWWRRTPENHPRVKDQIVEGEAKVVELRAAEGMALLETKRGRYWAFWDVGTQVAAPGTVLPSAPLFNTAPTFQQPGVIAQAPVNTPVQFPAKVGDRIAFSGLLTNNEIYLRRVGVVK